MGSLLQEIQVVNFRSARRLQLRPGPICALIGEPGAGKSNALLAVRALLDPGFDVSESDVTFGERDVSIEATLADGRTVSLDATVTALRRSSISRLRSAAAGWWPGSPTAPPVRSTARSDRRSSGRRRRASRWCGASRPVRARSRASSSRSRSRSSSSRRRAHRYLYRLIHRLADRGNQVFFTTHSPGLLNVAALDEVNLVSRDALGVTAVERLRPIDVDDTFRVMCEFDAERGELFFSRAAILVEGMTEKLALPFVFHALGHDADREQISIVECGGKSNLPLFVEICRRARIPYVVVHDSDCARAGRRSSPSYG